MSATSTDRPVVTTCDPAMSVTRSLLGYGVLAGPVYVAVSLVQASVRDGFDLSRHEWSLLANGPWGWIQITNLILSGAMVMAFALGLRRRLAGGPGAKWGPRSIAVYGASLVAAGIFRADPALGFPAGTSAGPGTVSWHGALHMLAGAVGFTFLAVGCFVLGRRYATEDRLGWAIGSRAVGVLFLAGFVAVATGGGRPLANLAFTGAVMLVWGWMAAVAVDLYRSAGPIRP